MFRIFIVFVIVFAVVVPVLAQDTPPTAVVPPVEDAANALITMLTGLMAGAVGLPITVTLVALLKRIPALNVVSGELLALAVAGVITVITWIARRYGFEGQVNASLEFLQVIIPALSILIGNLVASAAAYRAASAVNAPVIGYKRS